MPLNSFAGKLGAICMGAFYTNPASKETALYSSSAQFLRMGTDKRLG
jgi:hypothetical protein